MKKVCKNWTIDMPWGKLALVSWGNPVNPPVLLVHGYMDSAATFILLLDQLPDTHYYVGFDLPGHGLSDPYPPGPLITHIHWVEVIRRVVEHMKWDIFVYMCHSLGFLIGAFFNNIYPGMINKMVNLDPGPSLSWYCLAYDMQSYSGYFYNEIYENYDRYTNSVPKLYSKTEAVNAIATARHLSNEQAEVLLSRILVPAGDGLFRLSWDPRMKRIVSTLLPEETLFCTITTNPPPMLNFIASDRDTAAQWLPFEQHGERMLHNIKDAIPYFSIKNVRGGHDVHITNPEDLAKDIEDFLTQDVKSFNVKAKL